MTMTSVTWNKKKLVFKCILMFDFITTYRRRNYYIHYILRIHRRHDDVHRRDDDHHHSLSELKN